jgi:hypothetical protein
MCDKPGCDHDRLIDPQHTMCLCDVGAPAYVVAVAVDANGEQTFWLARKDLIGCAGADHGNENPPHEKLGRLAQSIRERIWGDALRCGRPRYDGQPCRQRVAEPGQSCAAHCDGQSCGKCRSCYINGEASR